MRHRRRSLTAALGGAAVTLSLTPAPLRAEPAATTSVLLPGAMNPESQAAFKDAVAGASPQVIGQSNGPVTVTPTSGTASVSMIAMGLDRFNTLAARVKRAIQDEAKPSFLQLLSRRLKTASVPTVKVSSTAFPATGESAGFSAPLTGVAVTQREKLGQAEKLTAALTGAQSAGVTAQLSEIASLPDQAKPVGAASAFIARYNDTLDKFGALILDPTAAHKEDLLATIAPTRNALIEVWPRIRAPEMSAVRRDALRRWNALSRQSPLKANYGAVSDFLPATYLQMYEQSRRVVGIGPYASPNCSGIVVGGAGS